jgi:hypothetical protein
MTLFRPTPDGLAQSAPPIGLAETSIRPQDDVPGFNLDKNGLPLPKATWFGGMLPSPQGIEDPGESTPPQFPEWLHRLLTMPLPPLSTAFDPRTGQRIVPYAPLIRPAGAYRTPDPSTSITPNTPVEDDGITSLPDVGRDGRLSEEERPSSNIPERPANINPDPAPATAQSFNPRSSKQATFNAWSQPLTDGQPYAQSAHVPTRDSLRAADASPPTTVSARPSIWPVADPNFILANAGAADMQQMQQQRPMPQGPQAEQKNIVTSPGAGPTDRLATLRLLEQPAMEMPERWHDEDLMPFIEVYRRAATDIAQDVGDATTRFGKRFYEDTILKAGRDLRQLGERFLDDPFGTTLSVLNSFPQTRTEGEFLAGFAAVFTILANAADGLKFEKAVIAALDAAKNKAKVGPKGQRQSIPDILNEGVTEIKRGLEIDNSAQLKAQAAHARTARVPFNLVVSPTTKRVSQTIKDEVYQSGGTIQRFDPATGIFTPFQ